MPDYLNIIQSSLTIQALPCAIGTVVADKRGVRNGFAFTFIDNRSEVKE